MDSEAVRESVVNQNGSNTALTEARTRLSSAESRRMEMLTRLDKIEISMMAPPTDNADVEIAFYEGLHTEQAGVQRALEGNQSLIAKVKGEIAQIEVEAARKVLRDSSAQISAARNRIFDRIADAIEPLLAEVEPVVRLCDRHGMAVFLENSKGGEALSFDAHGTIPKDGQGLREMLAKILLDTGRFELHQGVYTVRNQRGQEVGAGLKPAVLRRKAGN